MNDQGYVESKVYLYMERDEILEGFKTQIDLAEHGLLYLFEKSIKFVEDKFPSLDPPPKEDDDRLTELIHRQDTILATMSFLLDIGFRNGIIHDNGSESNLGR